MTHGSFIIRKFNRFKLRRGAVIAAETAVFVSGAVALAVLAVFWMDRVFILNNAARMVLLSLAVAAVSGWLVIKGNAARKLLSDFRMAEGIGAAIGPVRDYLASAVSFIKHGVKGDVSSALVDAHIERTARILAEHERVKVFPFSVSRTAFLLFSCAVCAAVLSAPAVLNDKARFMRVVLPFRNLPAETYFDIRPGDAVLPRVSAVVITARDKTGFQRTPGLEVRSGTGPWLPARWNAGADALSYSVPRLNEPVYYRLAWQDLKSRIYSLVPRDYPAFSVISARIQPPAYTARPPLELAGGYASDVLSGSKIEFEGTCKEPLSSAVLAMDEGQGKITRTAMRKNISGKYSASIMAERDADYWFELVSQDGWLDPEPVKNRIGVLADEPPFAAILSPSYETQAGPGEVVPVVYEVSDDIGVAAVDLVYETALDGKMIAGLSGFRRVKSFPVPGPVRKLGDTAFDLSGFPDGAEVKISIRAQDRNKGVSQSEPSVIIVRDYAAKHAETELGLFKLENMMRQLADEYKAESGRLAASSSAVDANSLRLMNGQWKEMASAFEELENSAREDALLNEGVKEELSSIKKRQEFLRKTLAPQFEKEAASGDKNAPQSGRELADELSRMADSMKSQRKFQVYKDLENNAFDMADQQNSIENVLKDLLKSGGAGATDEEWKQLEKTLGAIQKRLDELNDLISSMPDPRKMKGQDERKMHYVPVNSAQDLAGKLMEAIKNRDMKKAAELARQLSEQLDKMRKVFDEAAQDFAGSEMTSESQEISEKLQARLEDLVDRQSKALSDSQDISEAQAARRPQVQRAMLGDLASRQENLYNRAAPYAVYISTLTHYAMGRLAQEIRAVRIDNSINLHSAIMPSLFAVKVATPAFARDIEGMRSEEAAIGEELRKLIRPPVPSSDEEKRKMENGGSAQQTIRSDTDSLEANFKKEAGASISLPAALNKKLAAAAQEMKGAEGQLASYNAEEAAQAQARALKYLEDGRDEMSQSMSESRKKRQGYKSGRKKQSANGKDVSGRAKLPSAEDYMPPAEIREQAMQSMRENYPEQRSAVIKNYLKKLSE
ncbi:MAG: DUF4175 family protein [Elusimicrobiaceae bacterium]